MDGQALGMKFESAEEAWFWTVNAMWARYSGGRRSDNFHSITRPCDPEDVILCLDRLFKYGRVGAMHLRVLRIWGERQRPPDCNSIGSGDRNLWAEAMATLEPELRRIGILG
jgi:hypothetical protein